MDLERMISNIEVVTVYGKQPYGQYVGMDGRTVQKDPIRFPYTYDMYVTYKIGEKKEMSGGAYSDRLFGWDREKHDRLCKKHFGNEGQNWDSREPEKIEEFLRDYWSDPSIKLLAIMQGCNVSSGFPLWWFGWTREES